MTTEIATQRQPGQLAMRYTIHDIKEMAQTVVESGLFPALRNIQAAAALMLLCDAEGLHPMTAMRRYDIIQGRPAMRSDAMLGEFQARGGLVRWVKMDDKACEGVFSAPGLSAEVSIRWTMEMAAQAKLTSKENWKTYPRAMLRARVISEGVRSAMPAVVAGIYTTEETADMDLPPPLPPPKVEAPASSAHAPNPPAPATPPDTVQWPADLPGPDTQIAKDLAKRFDFDPWRQIHHIIKAHRGKPWILVPFKALQWITENGRDEEAKRCAALTMQIIREIDQDGMADTQPDPPMPGEQDAPF